MLSIVHTAETQFRHESAQRDRDLMLRARIRERQAALQELTSIRALILRPVVPAPLRAGVPRPILLSTSRRRKTTWARPIGAAVQHDACPTAA